MSEKDDNYIYLSSRRLMELTTGAWYNCSTDLRFTGVASHGVIRHGNLCFAVAISSWRRKGIDVVAELRKISDKGAAAIVVDRPEYASVIPLPLFVVEDVPASMQELATRVRRKLDCKVVLVAGSVGKTGFKTQLHHVLSPVINTHAVINSANVKLPILYSLTSIREHDKIEIVEVSGAARFEIGVERSTIVEADIVVFTNVSPNHMRVHGSIENFIQAKASAVIGMRPDAICVINRDSELYEELLEAILTLRPDLTIYSFGEHSGDAYIIEKSFDPKSLKWKVNANILGKSVHLRTELFHYHAPTQTAGILLVAALLHIEPQQAADNLPGLIPFETMGRFFRILLPEKEIFYYDQSLRGAIGGFRSAFKDLVNLKRDGRVIAIIAGCSTEMDGEFTQQQHEELAQLINESVIDQLYTVGPYLHYTHNKLNDEFKAKLMMHTNDKELIFSDVRSKLQNKDLIFVMGAGNVKMAQFSPKFFGLGVREQVA